jgi:ankyrin repeat protein
MKNHAKLGIGIVFLLIFALCFTSYSMKKQSSTTPRLSYAAVAGAVIGAGYLLYKKMSSYFQGNQTEGLLLEDQNKALLNAAKENDCATIGQLFNEGIDINITDSDGRTPLIWAVYNGSIDVVKCLLGNYGIAIDQQDKQGNTALLLAIKQKNILIIQQLLEAGADPEFVNKNGITPSNAAMRASYPRDYKKTVAEVLSLINKAIIKKRGGVLIPTTF